VKLLRFLQERRFVPLGSTEERRVDARVVAATNRDLEAAVRAGAFREDFYYRVNVFAIRVPALRERPEDVLPISERFLQARGAAGRLTPGARARLRAHPWPGNVRELENALERAVVLTKGETIPRSAIPDKIVDRKAEPLVADRAHANPTLDVVEQAYILWVLQSEGGNKTRAAEVLGIDPSTLYRKLSRYEGPGPGPGPE